MRSFFALPTPLLAFLFALPVLAEPLTPYDPFHNIATQVPKPPELPICCLRPLAPLDGTEEEVLLSFEEWKAKRIAGVHKDSPRPTVHPPVSSGHSPGTSDMVLESPAVALSATVLPFEQTEEAAPDAPYFRIPLTDRFNYASMDCSARVHTAHRTAKSTSSILSHKKDKYMLSPCGEKDQFVVVELCDDVRIDTVQLANYEFFSGVFKDFTVSVAKTYTIDPHGWTFAGTYRAKNVRGVQSFHPPTSLGDFYRFIRVDFHSHYGNEYYCPLSLLRVYGLTHLEHWKWDLWDSESREKQAIENVKNGAAEVVEEPLKPIHRSATHISSAPLTEDILDFTSLDQTLAQEQPSSATLTPSGHSSSVESSLETQPSSPQHAVKFVSSSSTLGSSERDSDGSPSTSVHGIPSAAISTGAHIIGEPNLNSTLLPTQQSASTKSDPEDQNNNTTDVTSRPYPTDSLYNSLSTSEPPSSTSVSLSSSVSTPSNTSQQLSSVSSSQPPASPSVSADQPHVARSLSSTSLLSTSPSAVPVHSQSPTVVPHSNPPNTGESIYRTIMNRLTALETNTTLYAKFVEEHTASVREMLRRLGEDVGRLDGITKAQAQTYQRTVSEFNRQQRRLELEHDELLSRVGRLTEEVILEKRLGIAQLCLLLTVLVFMALTRGSRNEPVQSIRSRTSSMGGWGRRTLSGDWDWVNRLKSVNRSPPSGMGLDTATATDVSQKPTNLQVKVEFPSQSVQTADSYAKGRRPHPITSSRKVGMFARPRTPVSLRTHLSRHSSPQNRPLTPTIVTSTFPTVLGSDARPPIQRAHSGSGMIQSFSTGTIGPVPKSAKRWARTAHLHEVKNTRSRVNANEDGMRTGYSSSARDTDDQWPRDTTQPEDVFGPQEELKWSHTAQNESHQRHKDTVAKQADLSPVSIEQLVLGKGGEEMPEADASEGDGWVDTDAESELGERRPSFG